MNAAYEWILEKFKAQGDYAFLPEGVLEAMLNSIIGFDEAFMEQAGVNEGAEYDDEAASAALFEKMAEKYEEYRMYMLRFTDDYLDYNEEYLISIDAIEWDD